MLISTQFDRIDYYRIIAFVSTCNAKINGLNPQLLLLTLIRCIQIWHRAMVHHHVVLHTALLIIL